MPTTDPFNYRVQKAFDYANDLTKQMITLATAIIGGYITFAQSSADKSNVSTPGKSVAAAGGFLAYLPGGMKLALIILAASVISGLAVCAIMTGILGTKDANYTKPSINESPLRYASMIQIGLFSIGTIMFVLFATYS